ncbi:hypothetical protein AAON49_13550 [Pseudotenacibaculum sp. MALMAid0570]|uniref:hypothetical protein n=1 Tax=Pseudotenacibaculum sp. MALMAid0570 TaxID=3143938 RepID=UPI0032DE9664
MRKLLLVLFLFIHNFFFSQEKAFYEQLAFDFYATEVLQKFPVKKKIKIYKWFDDYHPNNFSFAVPDCLKNIVWKNNNEFKVISGYLKKQYNLNSPNLELDFSKIDTKQFKIKKRKKGNFPKLFISYPHIEGNNQDRVFVNLYQLNSKVEVITYHIEFNSKDKVIDWCRKKTETIILH